MQVLRCLRSGIKFKNEPCIALRLSSFAPDLAIDEEPGPYPPVRLVGIYLTTFWSTNHWRRAHNTPASYVWTIKTDELVKFDDHLQRLYVVKGSIDERNQVSHSLSGTGMASGG